MKKHKKGQKVKSPNYMKLDQQRMLSVIVLDKTHSHLRKSKQFGKKTRKKVGFSLHFTHFLLITIK